MPDFSIHIPAGSPLDENVSGLPDEIKTYLGKGFAALARLPEDKLQALMEVSEENMASPFVASRADIASKLGINAEDVTVLMTAISFATFTLTSRADTPEAFVRALTSANVVLAAHALSALRLAQAIGGKRAALREALERSRIASAVLPSLVQFSTVTDLRLGFEKGQVGFAVPVVVIHLGTDAEGEEIWFQANEKQLENLIKDLEEARRRIDEAEKWAQSRISRE